MRKYLVLAFLALASALGAAADEGTVFERYPSAIGIYGNSLEAGGISYQRWLGGIGLQATAGGMYTSASDYGYSAELGLFARIFDYDFSDWFSGGLYGLALAGHVGRPTLDEGGGSVFSPGFHGAAGIGFEVVFFQHFASDLQVFYFLSNHSPSLVNLGLGGSFRYRF